MSRGEWTRSRYWLCHFLNSRHLRQAIPWAADATALPHGGEGVGPDALTGPPPAGALVPARRAAFARLAGWIGLGREADRQWLIAATVERAGDDPALIQAVRLMVKEQHYHRQLLDRLAPSSAEAAVETSPQPGRPSHAKRPGPLRRLLGLRFELSRLMLWQLIALELCHRLTAAAARFPRRHDPHHGSAEAHAGGGDDGSDACLQAVAMQWQRDLSAHLAFVAERLTDQYADFNFIRRNLRRYRLRGMFLWMATSAVLRHRRALAALGVSRRALLLGGWRRFRRVLEHVVPYHRDALLAALLDQQSRPWDLPPLGSATDPNHARQ